MEKHRNIPNLLDDEPIRFEELILSDLKEQERTILDLIERGAGSIEQLGELMGMSPITLTSWIRNLRESGIDITFYKK